MTLDNEIQKQNEEMFNETHEHIQENIYDVMKYVKYTLEEAKECHMETEIVVWALKYMKDDPTLTIKQAMAYSFNDWIK
jgi:hypothetical protein